MNRARGFTLLEMMMVLALLAVVAQVVLSTLPPQRTSTALDRLRLGAVMAWEQAQLEGRPWRLQLSARGWQLATLTAGEQGEPGPLPGTVWQAISGANSRGSLNAGEFRLASGNTLPATLWFFPEGEVTDAEVLFLPPEDAPQHLLISSTALGQPL